MRSRCVRNLRCNLHLKLAAACACNSPGARRASTARSLQAWSISRVVCGRPALSAEDIALRPAP
eukprot:4027167-Alexandrium_andersonii.AAC.1